MRKRNTGKKLLTYGILLAALLSFSGCGKKSSMADRDTEYLSPCYAVDMNNPKEVVGLSSNVFVGYVEKMADTYYISHIPYTRYEVKVINNIKGELPLDETVQVIKEGGISEDSSRYILLKDDILPKESEYYIFNTREGAEDGSYTASGINTTVLINDIDLHRGADGATFADDVASTDDTGFADDGTAVDDDTSADNITSAENTAPGISDKADRKQENVKKENGNKLENSSIYQDYVDAYENQVVIFDTAQ